jgi:hypothetical protein
MARSASASLTRADVGLLQYMLAAAQYPRFAVPEGGACGRACPAAPPAAPAAAAACHGATSPLSLRALAVRVWAAAGAGARAP